MRVWLKLTVVRQKWRVKIALGDGRLRRLEAAAARV
jgi:hypothetical protein